jgi:hypothetical protein
MTDATTRAARIAAEHFRERVGRDPVLDDLERCNCPDAGKLGHWFCGWCEDCDKPRFVCGHSYPPGMAEVMG